MPTPASEPSRGTTAPADPDQRWRHSLTAENHARASLNPIHDDPVANAYGFRGGLVPGVDVFAYFVHPLVRAWGPDFLSQGRLSATFRAPVYDGDEVTIEGTQRGTAGPVELALSTPSGGVCAVAVAMRDATGDLPLPDPSEWPAADPATRGRPASAESLAKGTVLVPLEVGFHADRAKDYLAEVGETHPVFSEAGVAHPGWLLRFSNFVLANHVELGPWIHVSSDARLLGVVRDGERVETRAVVVDEYERKGHRLAVLDVLVCADGRPVQQVTHTAIHTLRPARAD